MGDLLTSDALLDDLWTGDVWMSDVNVFIVDNMYKLYVYSIKLYNNT